jgi:hypothetical protein
VSPFPTRPDGTAHGSAGRCWDHEINETRLYADDERLATTDGSHRPNISNELPSITDMVTLEADIIVTLSWNSSVSIESA